MKFLPKDGVPDLTPFMGRMVEVTVATGPRQTRNASSKHVGLVSSLHWRLTDAEGGTPGAGSIHFADGTYASWSRFDEVTVNRHDSMK